MITQSETNALFDAAAAMRRSFNSFNAEISEFGVAASEDYRDGMDRARQRAHDFLDAYFDAISAAHHLGKSARPT